MANQIGKFFAPNEQSNEADGGSKLSLKIATLRRSTSGGLRSSCSLPMGSARTRSCDELAKPRPASSAGRNALWKKGSRARFATRRGPRASSHSGPRWPNTGKTIHAIVDNYATHKHPNVRQLLTRHPRWTFHFTPTSASWLNADRSAKWRWIFLFAHRAESHAPQQEGMPKWTQPSDLIHYVADHLLFSFSVRKSR